MRSGSSTMRHPARRTRLNGSGRSAAGATIEAARNAGLTEMPVRGSMDDHRSRRRPLVGRRTRTLRPAAVGDALRRRRSSSPPTASRPAQPGSSTIERGSTIFGTRSDWAAVFRPHGRRGEARRARPASGARPVAALDRRPGSRGRLHGSPGTRSATYLESRGSPLRAADLAAHRSDWSAPIATTYRGVTARSATRPTRAVRSRC